MKKLLLTLALISGLAYQAYAVPLAIAIGDAQYLGSINDGIPSNPANEATYINYLATLGAGAGNTQIPVGTGEIYNREGSTLSGPFPTAVTGGAIKEEDEKTPDFDNIINATGFSYILGKYDAGQAGSLVWYTGGGLGDVELPTTYMGKGLSHISLYNPRDPGTSVPDGGTTLALLGIGLLSMSYINRRKA